MSYNENEGMWPDEVVDLCTSVCEIVAASPGVSKKKGTRRMGLKLKVVKSIPIDREGQTTPFIDFWVSRGEHRPQAESFAEKCGQPKPDEAFYTKVPPESFDPDQTEVDELFAKWCAGFVGSTVWLNLSVEKNEQYGDRNKIGGWRDMSGPRWEKWNARYNAQTGAVASDSPAV
jgi:hypothetical protein